MKMFDPKRIRYSLAFTAALFVANGPATASTQVDSTTRGWDESSLAVSMPGGSGDTVRLGDLYQVLVTAKAEGHLYLLQQNSQERSTGKVRLVEVNKKVPGYRDGSAFMYPAFDSLEASPPLGLSKVQAVYASKALPLHTLAIGSKNGAEVRVDEKELVALIEKAQATDPSLRVAFQSVNYEVAMADGELEHTTRGIARQINTAITSADLEPDGDGILTSFDAHIQFEFGSATPTFNGQLQLDAFGDVLTRPEFEGIPFIVAGHTDDIGDEDFNLHLSDERAKAVTDYLQHNYGIPASRIIIEALGEDEPYVDNVDQKSRALNRRVEFTLLQ